MSELGPTQAPPDLRYVGPTVPRAARHLVDGALRTQIPEDRLTEILAVALQEHGAFRDGLLEKAGVPLATGTGDHSAEVRTQRLTPKGRLVDLEVVIREGISPIARLWCENKVGAAYQPNQLRDYHDALQEAASRARSLVTIARTADVAGADKVIISLTMSRSGPGTMWVRLRRRPADARPGKPIPVAALVPGEIDPRHPSSGR